MATDTQELVLSSFDGSTDNCLIFDDTCGLTETELETSSSPTTTNSSDALEFDNNGEVLQEPMMLPFDLVDIPMLDPELDTNLLEFTLTNFPEIPSTQDLLDDLFGPNEVSLSQELSADPDKIVTLDGEHINQNHTSEDQSYASPSNVSNPLTSKSSSSGDFSIDMDEDDLSYSYSTSQLKEGEDDSESSNSHWSATKRSPVTTLGPIRRPRCDRSKRRNSSSLLPYTVHDVAPQDMALHNEDLISGRPGERLTLTREEKEFMMSEGFAVPTHLPLTKEEMRALKTVRRKIRNKISAKNSRAKKQDYVAGLEQRVSICTEENALLRQRLRQAETNNKNLFGQVRHLRELVSRYMPQSKQSMLNPVAGTSLCLCMLTFLMVCLPAYSPFTSLESGPGGSAVPGLVGPGGASVPGGRRLLQESELATDLGDPYDITIRPGPAWQFPPQTPMIDLHRKTSTATATVAMDSVAMQESGTVSNSSEDPQLVFTMVDVDMVVDKNAGYAKEL